MSIDIDRVRRIVADALGAEESDVRSDERLREIAVIDSLSLAEVASALDDALGIRMPGHALSEDVTVAALAELAARAPRRPPRR